LELTNQQFYGILALVFGVILPVIWQFTKKTFYGFLEKSVLVESERIQNKIIGFLYNRHTLVTFILVKIGVIFALISLF